MTEALNNEKQLLLGVAEGNETAFALLFKKYQSKIFTVAVAITRSETVAEELVQDVFLKIWKNHHSISAIDNFEAYLFIIVRNESFRALKGIARQRKLMKFAEGESSVSGNYIEQEVYARECASFLNKAITALPKQQQQVLYLIREEGLSRKQVALYLHISPESVKTHMARAIKSIRTLLAGTNLIILLAFFAAF